MRIWELQRHYPQSSRLPEGLFPIRHGRSGGELVKSGIPMDELEVSERQRRWMFSIARKGSKTGYERFIIWAKLSLTLVLIGLTLIFRKLLDTHLQKTFSPGCRDIPAHHFVIILLYDCLDFWKWRKYALNGLIFLCLTLSSSLVEPPEFEFWDDVWLESIEVRVSVHASS